MRRRWLLVLALPVAVVPAAGASGATSCKAMTVGYAFESGSVIAIQPDHVDLAYEGCVQFTNSLDLNATITVEGGYSVTLGPKESTPVRKAYVGRTPGRRDVTATSGPSSADGSITVGPAPQRTTTPTHRSSPSRTAAPASHSPAAHPSSSRSSGPRVAPVPPTVGVHIPKSTGPKPPGPAPSVPPPPRPSPTPKPTATQAPAVLSFPVEPPSGRGSGLPGAVAALAVVGTGAGLVRVLLAEPIGAVDDGRRDVGGSA